MVIPDFVRTGRNRIKCYRYVFVQQAGSLPV